VGVEGALRPQARVEARGAGFPLHASRLVALPGVGPGSECFGSKLKPFDCGDGLMTVRDRVFSAFKESFDLDDDADTSKLVYQDYPAWTSIGHMILVAALESEFDTMLETDDILEMSNFDKAVSIMSKYAK
jgi:acyl carrier protein